MMLSSLFPGGSLLMKLAPAVSLCLSQPIEQTADDDLPAEGTVIEDVAGRTVTDADFAMSPHLLEAVRIAKGNARPRSTNYCWRYVKKALLAADAVDAYPNGASAKYAGSILVNDFGFILLDDITDPEDAPVGSVLVYGGAGHGHIEIRTADGYVSDFKTVNHSKRPLTGVYVKLDEPGPPADIPEDPEAILNGRWFRLREWVGGKLDPVLLEWQPIIENAAAQLKTASE